MKTILHLNTSIFGGNGQSSQLANEFVAEQAADRLIVRDLASEPVPHLDAARFGAFLSKPEGRTKEQQAVLDYSDKLIGELRQADVIVLGLPMYNFGVPSTLKAYFDHVARAGVTFRYTEKGPVGLLTGKKVYVFATRGGYYQGTPLDTQTAYVRDFFAFLGITDVEFIYAEGLAISEASKTASLAKAREQLQQLVPAYA
jgi:FMN-dependent NADH-azoreductase